MGNNHCVYVTIHKDGRYYIGKSTTYQISKGYKGSGVLISRVLKKYPGQFKTYVVKSGLTRDEAYFIEEMLVDDDTLADPLCLNLTRGGQGLFVTADGMINRNMRISKSRSKFLSNPANKEKQMEYLAKAAQARIEMCAATPITVDGIPHPGMSKAEVEKFYTLQKYVIKNVGFKKFTKIDRGTYCDGIRFLSAMAVDDYAKSINRVVEKVGPKNLHHS